MALHERSVLCRHPHLPTLGCIPRHPLGRAKASTRTALRTPRFAAPTRGFLPPAQLPSHCSREMSIWLVLGHNPRFAAVSAGLLVSRLGDAANSVALAWLVLGLAGPQALGIVVVCNTLPRVPTSLVAGHVLDKIEPRLLLRLDNLARALLILLLAILVWTRVVQVWEIYVIAIAAASLSALTAVGEGLITPALVPDEQLDAANSVLSITWEGASLIGPAAGSLVIALWGIAAPFVLDAATFVAMAAASLALPSLISLRTGDHEAEGHQPITAGLRTLLGLPLALLATGYTLVYLILSGAMEVEFPSLVKYQIHAPASALGLVMAATGAGAILGILLLTPRLQRWRPAAWIAFVFVGEGTMLILLGLVHSLALAIPITLLAFLLGGPYYPLERSLVQRAVPVQLRGRAFGARGAIASAGFPLGAALAGPATATFGAGPTFQVIGALLVATALIAFTVRPFRQRPDAH